MPRVEPLQPAFNAGEFGPRMIARADFAKYRNASRKFENLVALAQGGAMRRPGTRFVVPVKDESAKTRLIPFEFSTVQAYVIEAGDRYFRFCRNQGQIRAVDVNASITNGTFDSGITGWDNTSGVGGSITHDDVNKRLRLTASGTAQGSAQQEVINALSAEHTLSFRVYGAPGDTIKLRIGSNGSAKDIVADQVFGVGFHVTTFSATANFFIQFIHVGTQKSVGIDDIKFLDNQPVELVTPYETAQLFDLRFAQSADVLYICHGVHPVYKLLRLDHTSWSLEQVSFQDGPFLEINTTATTFKADAISGIGVNVTASEVIGINDNRGFLSTDVGRHLRISDGTDVGFGVITSVSSTTVVKVDIRSDFPDTLVQTDWRLGAWSETTGYPAVVNFHEQRLALANTTTDPDKYWMSQSGDFENFRIDSNKAGSGVEVQDDDALDYRISSDQVNAIQWIRSAQSFAIGTRGGEWLARSEGPILTPTDVDTKQQTTIGSAFIDPAQIDNAILFPQRGKRQIREFAFNFEADGFRSPDMTILSDHILRSRICEMAYAQAPDSLLYCAREDGRIAVLTYKREQDVIGWGRWVLGGSFGGGNAVVESVAVIPGNDGDCQVLDSTERDEAWFIVKRTINGATKRYIEVLEEAFEGPDRNEFLTEAAYETAVLAAQKDAFYLDSGITYNDVPETLILNLGHLEGETVKILADGAVHGDKVVTGGSVTLDTASRKVHIGLGYSHDMEPLKLDFGNPAGSALAKDKRVRQVSLVLHEAGALKIGADRSDIRAESLREVADPMDTAVPLFTGEFEAEIEGDYEPDPRLILRGDDPTPFTVLAIVPDVAVSVG